MNAALIVNIVLLVLLLAVVAGLLSQSIRVVREYQRVVVFRLGKCIGERGPGAVLLIPFVDRPVWVGLRELFVEVPIRRASPRTMSRSRSISWCIAR